TDEFVFAASTLNELVRYAASGLPPGLSIDPHTGEITGTTPVQSVSVSRYEVSLAATAASGSDAKTFVWTVYSDHNSNFAQLPNPSGGTFTIYTPDDRMLITASISPSAGVGAPLGLTFPFGFVSFELDGVQPGGSVDVIISGLNLSSITD